MITIRKLNIDDLNSYRNIRLELLKTSPTNFGSSFDEESLFDRKMWESRLTKNTISVFGAFDQELVGIVLTVENPREKMKHIASINSMYVKEKYRSLKVGDQLLKHALDYLKKKEVEQVVLSVVTTNKPAIKLYQNNGFVHYGTEIGTIKYEGEYYDLYLMRKVLR